MGSFYQQETMIFYRECPPGTWMTCIQDVSCEYTVPRHQDGNVVWVPDANTWQVPSAVRPFIPIGQCYPCEYASYTYQYQKNPDACTNNFNPQNAHCRNLLIYPKNFGSLYCLGSSYTPLICPDKSVSSVDYTHCICQDGYYNPYSNDNSQCVICPPGHYCVQNVKYVCPDGTYQHFEGKNQCDFCDVDGNPIWKCSNNQLPAKCTLSNDPVTFRYLSNLTCVACAQCKNKILQSTLPPGSTQTYLDCYDV